MREAGRLRVWKRCLSYHHTYRVKISEELPSNGEKLKGVETTRWSRSMKLLPSPDDVWQSNTSISWEYIPYIGISRVKTNSDGTAMMIPRACHEKRTLEVLRASTCLIQWPIFAIRLKPQLQSNKQRKQYRINANFQQCKFVMNISEQVE